MPARPWLAVLVLALAAPHAAAQDTLAWRYDGPLFLESRLTTTSEVMIVGRTEEKKATSRITLRLRPTRKGDDPDGPAFDGTVLTSKQSGNAVEAGDSLDKLAGKRFRLALGPGHAKAVATGGANLVDGVFGGLAAGATPAERRFLAAVLDNVLLTQTEEAFPPVPADPVEPGATWKHTTRAEIASILAVKVDRTYKLLGRVVLDGKPLVAVGMTARATFSPPDAETTALPFKIVDVRETRRPRYEGTVYFDPAAGRPHRVDLSVEAHVRVTVAVNGQEATGSVVERRAASYLFHPADPDAARDD